MYFVKASAIWTDGFHFTVHTLNVIKKLNAVEKREKGITHILPIKYVRTWLLRAYVAAANPIDTMVSLSRVFTDSRTKSGLSSIFK